MKRRSNSRMNGLGTVARERYEEILRGRVRACLTAQEAKVKAQYTHALGVYLERHGLADALRQYRAALEVLMAHLGKPPYRPWLGEDIDLLQYTHMQEEVEEILRGMAELQPVYAELARLRRLEARIAEKVWLAGAPSEIADLLAEIGEPSAN